MTLTEIPGHQETKAYLSKIVREDRIPHAMLLVGSEGVGTLALALAFAQLIQCANNSEGTACGNCPSCKKAIQNIHPDIHFAFPVIKKDSLKREDTTSAHFLEEWRAFLEESPYGNLNDWLFHLDAADKNANINVKECNQIIKNLGLQSYEGKYKVQIIWNAERLGKEGNRLLKLIEEPTDDTIIIMICSNRKGILNTLLSRCQILAIPPAEDQAILDLLEQQYDLSEEDREELTYMAGGNIRKALRLGTENELNYSEDLMAWLRASYSGDPEKIIEMIDHFSAMGKQELVTFMEYGLHFLRETLILLSTGTMDGIRLTSTEKEVATKMTTIMDLSKVEALSAWLEKSIGYIRRNISVKTMLMHMSLEINQILRAEVDNFMT